ncbi:MAG: fibronectin type III domain-containing protein [Kiritimatiellae bacterium]|nr:fibronectin type III domain-containing protein [Kiritimatiellia bacterium]
MLSPLRPSTTHTCLLCAALLCGFAAPSRAATVAKPTFSRQHGFYDSTFSVTISSATAGATIRYTTNGSAPSAAYGTVLANGGSVSISRTTCLRAVGCMGGMTTSTPFTQTYIFLANILTQTRPADYPSVWPADSFHYANQSDYDMDPNIVNNSAYSGMIRNAFKAIPTLSLVMKKEDMFNASVSAGVYTQGGSGGLNTLEKPGSVELIYPDGRAGFQIDCGIKPHSHPTLKRSFRFLFKTNYGGPQKLNYPFFEDAPLNAGSAPTSFGKIFLRAGMNRCWAGYMPENQRKTTYVRDQWARDSQIAMSGAGSRGTFMHLYINGLYWGLYNPVERPDARFAADHFGGAKTDWFCANHAGDVSGSDSRWNYFLSTLSARTDLDNAARYDEMRRYLDVSSFCDYVILCWYTGVGDWQEISTWSEGGFNNLYWINRNNAAAPGMYMAWDAESSWHDSGPAPQNTPGRSHDGAWIKPQFLTAAEGSSYPYDPYKNRHVARPFRNLFKNPDFRVLFADRLYRHVKNGGALTDANSRSRWSTLCSYVKDAVVCESARWGDGHKKLKTPDPLGTARFTRNDHWYGARDAVLSLMNGNGDRLLTLCRNQTMNGAKLYPSLDPPTYQQHGGTVAAGFKLTISRSQTGTIYYRTDGADPRESGGGVRSGTSSSTSSAEVTLNSTSTVMARLKNAATWSALAEATFTVTGSGPLPPAAPSNLAAAAQSATSIALSWQDNSNNETGFKIDRRKSGTDIWERITDLAAGATTHSDSGLPASTKFYYMVKAYNAAGNSDYSNVADATTEAAVMPPSIAVSTASISVSCVQGQNAPDVTFQVWNGGGVTLAYTVVESSSLLSIAPASGTSTGSADKNTHTITFATAGLTAGTYDREFTVEDNGSGAANGPVSVAVEITVTSGGATSDVRVGAWEATTNATFDVAADDLRDTIHFVHNNGSNLYYSSSTDGGASWTTDRHIGVGQGPAIAVDHSGTVHLVYEQPRYGRKMFYRRYAQGAWSAEQDITTGVPAFPDIRYWAPRVEVDGSNNVHIIYWTHPWGGTTEDWDNCSRCVYYCKRAGQADFDAPQLWRDKNGTGHALHGALFRDEDGHMHIFYKSYIGGYNRAVERRLRYADGSWGRHDQWASANYIDWCASAAVDSSGTVHFTAQMPVSGKMTLGYWNNRDNAGVLALKYDAGWETIETYTDLLLEPNGDLWLATGHCEYPDTFVPPEPTGEMPNIGAYYRYSAASGAWSGRENISPDGYVNLDHRRQNHPRWLRFRNSVRLFFAQKAPGGNWRHWQRTFGGDPAPTPPAAPSNLTAAPVSASRIDLAWTDNSNNETGFKIDRRKSGTTTWERIATPGANATAYSDSDLPAGTKFYYMVKAYNAAGNSDYSNLADATTQAGTTPPSIAVSTTSVSVSCAEGQDAPDATFQVWNGGGGSLAYSVVESTSKFSIAPTSGTSAGSADKNTHTITFATAGLAAGTYGREFTVEDNGSGAANGPVSVAVEITVTDAAPPSEFTAYNDLAWFAGQPNQNISTYTTTNGFAAESDSGLLVDYASGRQTGVRLTVAGGRGVIAAQGLHPASGTDAYNVFNAKLSGAGTISYGTEDLTLTFSGLDPARRYELVLYADRGAASYTGPDARGHYGTLIGAEAFENASTPGTYKVVDIDNHQPEDTTLYNAGYNTQAGYVTRFRSIEPGADGRIVLRLKQGPDTNYAGYFDEYYTYANALMLRTQPDSFLPLEQDGDRDAMADAWETAHFGGTAVPNGGAQDDFDGDGMSNAEEYIAGTDPTGSAATFAVAVELAGPHIAVSLPTVAASGPAYTGLTRRYAIECRDSLAGSGGWQAVPGYEDFAATDATVTYTNAGPAGTVLYRGKVWLGED